jgi:hypothetical protein
LEDAFFDILLMRKIDQAYGPHLDVIGRIVNEPRNELVEDEDYRLVIRAKIRVLLSKGTGDDLLRIALLILGDTAFAYSEHYPAQVQFDILEPTERPLAPNLLLRLLRRAKAGGVRIDVSASDPDAFRFEDVSDPSPDLTHGFGDVLELPDITGAPFAGLV